MISTHFLSSMKLVVTMPQTTSRWVCSSPGPALLKYLKFSNMSLNLVIQFHVFTRLRLKPASILSVLGHSDIHQPITAIH